MIDYCKFYDLETYIMDSVHNNFINQGYLSAFDFFCIVIWKANRAKSKIAKRICMKGNDNLEEGVKELTSGIFKKQTPKEKLKFLLEEWNFQLPMSSAILTILYPDEFTIYDIRVCDTLGEFHNLNNLVKFESIWEGYQKFKEKVQKSAPESLSLRDKDRYLWGMSFYNQLQEDIEISFLR